MGIAWSNVGDFNGIVRVRVCACTFKHKPSEVFDIIKVSCSLHKMTSLFDNRKAQKKPKEYVLSVSALTSGEELIHRGCNSLNHQRNHLTSLQISPECSVIHPTICVTHELTCLLRKMHRSIQAAIVWRATSSSIAYSSSSRAINSSNCSVFVISTVR